MVINYLESIFIYLIIANRSPVLLLLPLFLQLSLNTLNTLKLSSNCPSRYEVAAKNQARSRSGINDDRRQLCANFVISNLPIHPQRSVTTLTATMNCPSRTDDTDGREGWNQSPNLLAGTTRADFNGRTNATARRSLDPDVPGEDDPIAQSHIDTPPPLDKSGMGEKGPVVGEKGDVAGHVTTSGGNGGGGGEGGGALWGVCLLRWRRGVRGGICIAKMAVVSVLVRIR